MPRSIPTTTAEMITVGVDTHKDIHVAVALDGLGRRLGALTPASRRADDTRCLYGTLQPPAECVEWQADKTGHG